MSTSRWDTETGTGDLGPGPGDCGGDVAGIVRNTPGRTEDRAHCHLWMWYQCEAALVVAIGSKRAVGVGVGVKLCLLERRNRYAPKMLSQ